MVSDRIGGEEVRSVEDGGGGFGFQSQLFLNGMTLDPLCHYDFDASFILSFPISLDTD